MAKSEEGTNPSGRQDSSGNNSPNVQAGRDVAIHYAGSDSQNAQTQKHSARLGLLAAGLTLIAAVLGLANYCVDPPTDPAPVTELHVSEISRDAALVDWAPYPEADTTVELAIAMPGSADFQVVERVNATAGSARIDRLEQATRYRLRATAVRGKRRSTSTETLFATSAESTWIDLESRDGFTVAYRGALSPDGSPDDEHADLRFQSQAGTRWSYSGPVLAGGPHGSGTWSHEGFECQTTFANGAMTGTCERIPARFPKAEWTGYYQGEIGSDPTINARDTGTRASLGPLTVWPEGSGVADFQDDGKISGTFSRGWLEGYGRIVRADGVSAGIFSVGALRDGYDIQGLTTGEEVRSFDGQASGERGNRVGGYSMLDAASISMGRGATFPPTEGLEIRWRPNPRPGTFDGFEFDRIKNGSSERVTPSGPWRSADCAQGETFGFSIPDGWQLNCQPGRTIECWLEAGSLRIKLHKRRREPVRGRVCWACANREQRLRLDDMEIRAPGHDHEIEQEALLVATKLMYSSTMTNVLSAESLDVSTAGDLIAIAIGRMFYCHGPPEAWTSEFR